MRDLEACRKAIDEIDQQLIRLFEARLAVVEEVGAWKEKNAVAVLQAGREEAVLEQVRRQLENPEYEPEMLALFRSMMQISRHLQNRCKVKGQGTTQGKELALQPRCLGFQGVAGAFSEEALISFFGETLPRQGYETFEALFQALSQGEVEYGILPIENSSTGSVNEVYDLLLKHQAYIVGEYKLQVVQHLLGVPESRLEYIEEVYSHPQGLAQCAGFLKTYPHWRQIPYYNTAISARMVMESGLPSKAAIASERAAAMYGLKILAPSINDHKDNHTLFIIVGREKEERAGADKVSVVFHLANEPGALSGMLEIFARHQVNMTKIESRPIQYRPWEYVFYANFETDPHSPALAQALAEAENKAQSFRVIGVYPRHHV